METFANTLYSLLTEVNRERFIGKRLACIVSVSWWGNGLPRL